MSPKNKLQAFWPFIIIAINGLALIFRAAFDVWGFEGFAFLEKEWVYPLAVTLFIIFVIVQVIQYPIQINRLLGEKPNLFVSGILPTQEEQSWQRFYQGKELDSPNHGGTVSPSVYVQHGRYPGSDSDFVTIPDNQFIHVLIRNNPNESKLVKMAEKVRAYFSFFDLDYVPINMGENREGVWKNNLEQSVVPFKDSNSINTTEITVPDGREVALAILVKSLGSAVVEAYSQDWWNTVRFARVVLPNDEHFVRVKLKGKNVNPPPFWFRLQKENEDGQLGLIHLSNTEKEMEHKMQDKKKKKKVETLLLAGDDFYKALEAASKPLEDKEKQSGEEKSKTSEQHRPCDCSGTHTHSNSAVGTWLKPHDKRLGYHFCK